MIFEIIDGLHRFLGYLNINMNYLNKFYTIVAALPMAYHIKLLFYFAHIGNTSKLVTYSLLFIVFLYFWVLNFLFYFFGFNTKLDITQWIAKVAPDEMFDEVGSSEEFDSSRFMKVNITDYVGIESVMEKLINNKVIVTHEEIKKGYIIDKDTLIPYFDLRLEDKNVNVFIGESYDSLVKVGFISNAKVEDLQGVFIYGGEFIEDGIKFKDKYKLKVAKKET